MEYLLFWIVCAIFSSILAGQRNRSQLVWFFIGLIFGPFGLLVLAFPKIENSLYNNYGSNKTTTSHHEPIQVSNNILNSALDNINKGRNIKQISGRVDISLYQAAHACWLLFKSGDISKERYEWLIGRSLTLEEEEDSVPKKKCPYCAETIKAKAILCRYCGKDLSL